MMEKMEIRQPEEHLQKVVISLADQVMNSARVDETSILSVAYFAYATV
jgi:hypothetical protein